MCKRPLRQPKKPKRVEEKDCFMSEICKNLNRQHVGKKMLGARVHLYMYINKNGNIETLLKYYGKAEMSV